MLERLIAAVEQNDTLAKLRAKTRMNDSATHTIGTELRKRDIANAPWIKVTPEYLTSRGMSAVVRSGTFVRETAAAESVITLPTKTQLSLKMASLKEPFWI